MHKHEQFPVNRPVTAINFIFNQLCDLRLVGLLPVEDERPAMIRYNENNAFMEQVEAHYNLQSRHRNQRPHGLHLVSLYFNDGRLQTDMYQAPGIRFGYKLFAQINSRGNPVVGEQCVVFDDADSPMVASAVLTRANRNIPGARRGYLMPTSIASVPGQELASIHNRFAQAIDELDTVRAIRQATTSELGDQVQYQRLTAVPSPHHG